MTAMSECERLRLYINNLFDKHFDDDGTENLRHVADYYAYLANGLNRASLLDTLSEAADLIGLFEGVYLWVRDALAPYPVAIQQQLNEVFAKPDLCRLFAQLADLQPRAAYRLVRGPTSLEQLSQFRVLGMPIVPAPRPNVSLLRQECEEARLSLRRASQMLRYASSLDTGASDDVAGNLEDHYNPGLIDRHRLLALLNLLRSELNGLPPTSPARRLLPKIDAIEIDLRRNRVKWGRVIAGAFVVFSFLADLHELAPDAYGQAFRVAQALIATLQTASPERLPRFPEAPLASVPPDAILLPPAAPQPEPSDDDA